MAYDHHLAGRIREMLREERHVVEKAMFGRRMFMVGGKLAVGVSGDELMVRAGPEGRGDALAQPHARPCVMSGRAMEDWVLVSPEGLRDEPVLDAWLCRGVQFARSQVQA